MTRKFLQGLGIDTDVIDKIMSANGDDIEREKGVAETLRKEIGNLKLSASEAQKELDNFRAESDREGWKGKYETEAAAHAETKIAMQTLIDDEKAAHKKTQDGYAAEKDAAEKDGLVSLLLGTPDEQGVSMNAAAIPKAVKLYDRGIVKRGKDGTISNADEVRAHFRNEWSDFFGAAETKPADVGGPQNGGKTPPSDPFMAGFDRT